MPMDMHNHAIQRNWQVEFKRQAKEQNNENMREALAIEDFGCFPFSQTNQLETSGIIKRKRNEIFQLKQSLQ